MDKNEIRKHYKEKRASLGPEDHLALSKEALDQLTARQEYQDAKHIFAFINMGDEINTSLAIEKFLEDGKKVYVPITKKGWDKMKFTSLESMDHLHIGNFNVPEPKEEYINYVDHNIVDLVLVPGLAFDEEGYRTGYGGGFYDKFFADLSKEPVKAGYCFSVQLAERVPRDQYDIPVDFIISDRSGGKHD